MTGKSPSLCPLIVDFLSETNRYYRHKYQESINGVPNFKLPVEDDGETYDVHFVGLFSQKKDAMPLLLSHGWPGKPRSMMRCSTADMSY